mgnify:FL=1
MIEKIKSLVRLHSELTGFPCPCLETLSYMQQGEAREWLNAGFTEADLRTMVAFRKGTVEDKGILKAMLRWRFLIDPVRFGEDLPEARAYVNRRRAPSDRTRVMEASGRPQIKDGKPPRTAEQIMKDNAAFEAFKQAAKELRTP